MNDWIMVERGNPMDHKALFFRRNDLDHLVVCTLCPHKCNIMPGKTGLCKVRKNDNGTLVTLNYLKFSSKALDPIEKKPLSHFHPGSKILSFGSVGCNLRCPFCQNYSIATASVDYDNTFSMTAREVVDEALQLKQMGNIGIAYTYNEPSVWFETVLEIAKSAKRNNLLNVMVTNGYINEEPLKTLIPFIDAVNIDLKCFNDKSYHTILGGSLEPVKKSLSIYAGYCHTEVTVLIIPGFNDSREEMRELCRFLVAISPKIILHINRFFPAYQWSDIPPTPVKVLYDLAFEAQKYLKNVQLGNI
jgi:pyruvate formate lyase activating enzyme